MKSITENNNINGIFCDILEFFFFYNISTNYDTRRNPTIQSPCSILYPTASFLSKLVFTSWVVNYQFQNLQSFRTKYSIDWDLRTMKILKLFWDNHIANTFSVCHIPSWCEQWWLSTIFYPSYFMYDCSFGFYFP